MIFFDSCSLQHIFLALPGDSINGSVEEVVMEGENGEMGKRHIVTDIKGLWDQVMID